MFSRVFAGVVPLLLALQGPALASDPPPGVFASAPAAPAVADDSFASRSAPEGSHARGEDELTEHHPVPHEDPPHLHHHLGAAAPVPEPSTWVLLAGGALLLASSRRLRRRIAAGRPPVR